MKYNETVVVAAIGAIFLVLGITIGAELFSPMVCEKPPCEPWLYKYQALVVGVIAFLAAAFAAVPVWRQLSEVSLQSAIQTRTLLYARASGASAAIAELSALQDEIRPLWVRREIATNTTKELFDLVQELSRTYVNNERLRPGINATRMQVVIFQENLANGHVQVRAGYKKIEVDVFAPEENVQIPEAIHREITNLIHHLGVFHKELSDTIAPLDAQVRRAYERSR